MNVSVESVLALLGEYVVKERTATEKIELLESLLNEAQAKIAALEMTDVPQVPENLDQSLS